MSAKPFVAVLLTLALVVLSPGTGAYQAWAAADQKGPAGVPNLTLPVLAQVPAQPVQGLTTLPQAPDVAPQLPRLPTAIPILPQVELPQGQPRAETLIGGLQAEGKALESEGGRFSSLANFFTGSKSNSEDAAAVSGNEASAAALTKLSLDDLAAAARDGKRDAKGRFAAVKAIADLSSEPARLKLEEIGTEVGGRGADYEVKRVALRALSDQGKLVSLPPVSDEHKAELLDKISANKPDLLAVDYDRTLAERGSPLSTPMAARLATIADSGIETAIVTDRPVIGRREGELSIFESIEGAASGMPAKISVAAHRGARISIRQSDGSQLTVHEAASWTAAEKAAVSAVVARATGREASSNAVNDYDAYATLSGELDDAALARVGDAARDELAKAGVHAEVSARRPIDSRDQPYLFIDKYDKSEGVSALRRLRERLVRLRDIEARLPAAWRPAARFLTKLLREPIVPAASTLVVGDQFFGERSGDGAMLKGAPGAMALAVGGKADPRLDNVFLWPTQGTAATGEILDALVAKPKGAANNRALVGFFTQRTIAMLVYVPTTVALPFIAIPAVGVAAFGVLLAFGTLTGVALGPLNGMIAKKFSSRGAIYFNTAVRIGLHSTLPVLWALGLLANPIVAGIGLFIVSVGNGWLMSSIVATDNIILSRIAGPRFGVLNTLGWMNYLAVQVVMGIFIGYQGYIGAFSKLLELLHLPSVTAGGALMIPFVISALAHLALFPLVAATIPADKPVAAAKAEVAGPGAVARATGFLRRYWLAATVFAVGLAAYFYPIVGAGGKILHTTIPAALALIFWVTRTPDFKTLWKDGNLRAPVIFAMLGAAVFYPLQFFLLPQMAEAIAGAAGKEQLLIQLMGSLFFGQLISNGSTVKLPKLHLPVIGRFGGELFIKAAVVLTAGAWSAMSLFPSTSAAALWSAGLLGVTPFWGAMVVAGMVAVAVGLMIWASAKVSDRGWVKFVGVGLSAIALSVLAPTSTAAAFAAVFAVGVFFGPASVAISNLFYPKLKPENREAMVGVQSSMFNGAITIGFGVVSLLSAFYSPVMPGLMLPVSVLFAATGLAFFFGARWLKNLPKDILRPKEK